MTDNPDSIYFREKTLSRIIEEKAPSPGNYAAVSNAAMSASNTVSHIASNTNIVFSIEGDDLTISTNGVVIWKSSAVQPGPVPPVPSYDKRYAMFIIPMNDKAYSGRTGHFCHFELKASTNNFSAATDFVQRCPFYTHSAFADEFYLENDKVRLFINHGGGSHGGDERSYVRISNTLEGMEAGYCPSEIVVIVDVSLLNPERSDGAWLHESNEDLMWTYVRSTDGVAEETQSREQDVGGGFLWRPIAPVRWFSRLPNWASMPVTH